LDRHWIVLHSLALLSIASLWLTPGPVRAAAFKCLGPDGHTSYQQTPCPVEAAGGELTPDTRPPGGAEAAANSGDYSVESQLKAMESARQKARKAREQATADERQAQRKTADRYDKARCAKHRAESARWRQAIRNGYRNRDEREQQKQMLKHHEALTERYCAPEP
jgi:hypothetical protein